MKIIKFSLVLLIGILLTNCGEKKETFPLNKRYWGTNDYDNVTRTLKYGIQPDEKLPSFDDPETRAVIEKYADPQNYLVVLDDKELGTKHKNRIAQEFFNKWQDMITVYNARDRKDNFIYEKEMLKVFQFGLGLQIRYFSLGNKELLESADKEEDVRSTIDSNIQTLISNYQLYLNFIKDEKSFSDEGKRIFSDGLVKYYTELIEKYPKADYKYTKSKMEALKKKAKSDTIKNALTKIIKLIESKEVLNKK